MFIQRMLYVHTIWQNVVISPSWIPQIHPDIILPCISHKIHIFRLNIFFFSPKWFSFYLFHSPADVGESFHINAIRSRQGWLMLMACWGRERKEFFFLKFQSKYFMKLLSKMVFRSRREMSFFFFFFSHPRFQNATKYFQMSNFHELYQVRTFWVQIFSFLSTSINNLIRFKCFLFVYFSVWYRNGLMERKIFFRAILFMMNRGLKEI